MLQTILAPYQNSNQNDADQNGAPDDGIGPAFVADWWETIQDTAETNRGNKQWKPVQSRIGSLDNVLHQEEAGKDHDGNDWNDHAKEHPPWVVVNYPAGKRRTQSWC